MSSGEGVCSLHVCCSGTHGFVIITGRSQALGHISYISSLKTEGSAHVQYEKGQFSWHCLCQLHLFLTLQNLGIKSMLSLIRLAQKSPDMLLLPLQLQAANMHWLSNFI